MTACISADNCAVAVYESSVGFGSVARASRSIDAARGAGIAATVAKTTAANVIFIGRYGFTR
jgi:hypothetical protein